MISLPQNSENLNWLWARRLVLDIFSALPLQCISKRQKLPFEI